MNPDFPIFGKANAGVDKIDLEEMAKRLEQMLHILEQGRLAAEKAVKTSLEELQRAIEEMRILEKRLEEI